ncbi:MAG: DUF4037 domain-containing protein [Thermoplasmata archaeon]|nr:DUF4037 domain-containing protein [Thermoplasmata archaeon]
MSDFVPGRELNRRFYLNVVAPLVRSRFPRLRYSAGLLGPGSEVLGYDTERSQDHDWGPRAQLFLPPENVGTLGPRVLETLGRSLPPTFEGFTVRFTEPQPDGARVRVSGDGGPGGPLLWVGTIRQFFQDYLHVDSSKTPSKTDWLLLPSPKLRSIADGLVFRDELGLARAIARFRYFPRDVWLHLLAVQWLRISEEEAFVGRAGELGDTLGSRLLAARQVREMMRLAFLLERRYWPYDKWFGTAFSELGISRSLRASLHRALGARTARARELTLSKGYEILARRQNELRIAPPLPEHVSRYHDRPYWVIHGGEYAEAIRSRIRDREVRKLARIGSIDQFGDTEELGSHREQLQALRALVRA